MAKSRLMRTQLADRWCRAKNGPRCRDNPGREECLPVGLTLTGPRYKDRHLLTVAASVAPVLDRAIAR